MLEFLLFRLDVSNQCLWLREEGSVDRRVALPPTGFAVLRHLVENAGRLITEKELLEAVWPRIRVEPQAVKKQIFAIRKMLGDDPRSPVFIETLPRRGYQFIAPVRSVRASDPSSATRHNLPEQLTSFIGRDQETAELRQMLLEGTRLLNLTGAGGCGKTRLALHVVADMHDAYPDGIWMVELAALADPGFVSRAVANVFGLKEQAGKNPRLTLANHFASRRMLLILDNAEHVLAECAHLAEFLLRQCAQLVILVTSRERLGIAGESTYRVPSLSVPDPRQDEAPENVSSYESARLFIERSRLQRPQFSVTLKNAPAVASICRRLDGIPLAIELAAARMRSMSAEEVSQRLDQRFGLLTGGPRTALPRQRTLRSLIDWSYDLLGDAEKTMLSRVSVFSGGWTLEAAECVGSGEGVDRSEALELLTSLEDKSLVVVDEHDGGTRYGLLETVRQYARDRLHEDGDESTRQRLHLDYFLAFVERAVHYLNGPEEEVWLDRLELEHDNLRSALDWSSATDGQVAKGLHLAGALRTFWWARGYLATGRAWYSKLLAATPASQPAATRAEALAGAGHLAEQQGDYAAAEALLNESLVIQRELGDRNGVSRALRGLGIIAMRRGNHDAARAMLEEGLAIQRELGNELGVAAMLLALGSVAFECGDHAAARVLNEECLTILRASGDRANAAVVLNNLGASAYQMKDYRVARVLYEESLAIGRELGVPMSVALALNNLGMVASAEGDHAAAWALCKEGLVIRQAQGDRWGMAPSLEAIAVTYSVTAPRTAARIWGRAAKLREEIDSPMPPDHRPLYDQQIAAAREAIHDDPAFDRAWQEGRGMTLERAIAYALDEES